MCIEWTLALSVIGVPCLLSWVTSKAGAQELPVCSVSHSWGVVGSGFEFKF